jgi:hypothetical protein
MNTEEDIQETVIALGQILEREENIRRLIYEATSDSDHQWECEETSDLALIESKARTAFERFIVQLHRGAPARVVIEAAPGYYCIDEWSPHDVVPSDMEEHVFDE